MSVPSTSETQATFAATLVDEWVRRGLREVVVCPGSRSTPMALAVVAHGALTVHVRIDERSAGFFALGCAKRSGRPVAIVVTSGTAATELHAAVAEAHHGGVPLLVVTADRPPELRGIGALQTTDQQALFGSLVRHAADPGVASESARAQWRPLAATLVEAARGPRPGPVHANLAFVEPLTAGPADLPASIAAPPDDERDDEHSLPDVGTHGAVLVVAGPGASPGLLAAARARGWVVLGDVTVTGATPYVDAIMSHDGTALALAPSLVIRTGGVLLSKHLSRRLHEWSCPVVALDGAVPTADPERVVTGHGVAALPLSVDADPSYATRWGAAVRAVAEVAQLLDEPTQMLSEPSVARAVTRAGAALAAPLVVGSSMPIRDVEWWTEHDGVTLANRGLSGIDGVTSTALGVAVGGRALGLVGDVTFLHDVSALVDGLGGPGSCALVVVDNGGGGIFGFLPQAREVDPATFDRVFATPRPRDIAGIAHAFGHASARVTTVAELDEAVTGALAASGLTVVVARVPHFRDNVTLHDELNQLARDALDDVLAIASSA